MMHRPGEEEEEKRQRASAGAEMDRTELTPD